MLFRSQKDVYVSPLSYVPHFYHGKQSYDENRQLEQSSYRLCYIVKDEMVLLKSFYKNPFLKPLVSKNFGPYVPGFHFVDFNNLEELESLFQKIPNFIHQKNGIMSYKIRLLLMKESNGKYIKKICH